MTFPKAEIEKAGYRAVWRGQKSWNGVAILARGREPIVTRSELPHPDDAPPAAAVDGGLTRYKTRQMATRSQVRS